MKNDPKEAQENEYVFPYHYIANFEKGFVHCVYDAWGINYAATLEYILTRLNNESFTSIVDVGCGDGRLASEIAMRFPDAKVTGIDYSDRAINLAKAMNPAVDYQALDITRGTVNQRYDVALLIEVFEHIPPADASNFLSSLARLLVADGVLYMTVPHVNKPVEYKHYRHFSVELLKDCLEPNFTVQEIMPFEWKNWRMRLIDRFLCNRYFILNHRGLRQYFYNYFKKHAFDGLVEEDCQRIFVKAVVK